jgi:hypothetical protein
MLMMRHRVDDVFAFWMTHVMVKSGLPLSLESSPRPFTPGIACEGE